MKEAKKQYNLLLETGDLFELFDDLVGSWEEDKESFIKHYEETDLLLHDSFDIDELLFEDEDDWLDFD